MTRRRICHALFIITLALIIGTESAIKNGYPGYIQFWVLVGVAGGLFVAGFGKIEITEKEETD